MRISPQMTVSEFLEHVTDETKRAEERLVKTVSTEQLSIDSLRMECRSFLAWTSLHATAKRVQKEVEKYGKWI